MSSAKYEALCNTVCAIVCGFFFSYVGVQIVRMFSSALGELNMQRYNSCVKGYEAFKKVPNVSTETIARAYEACKQCSFSNEDHRSIQTAEYMYVLQAALVDRYRSGK